MEPLYCEICDHENPNCLHVASHRVEILGLGGTFVVCVACRDALRQAGKLNRANRLEFRPLLHKPAEPARRPSQAALAGKMAKWLGKLGLWLCMALVVLRAAAPAPEPANDPRNWPAPVHQVPMPPVAHP